MAVTVAKPPVSITENQPAFIGQMKWVHRRITFDASYPNTGVYATSGEPVTPAQLGLEEVYGLLFLRGSQGSAGYEYEYDRVNERLHVYWGDNNNASDGPMVEVADTTNLNTLVIDCLAIGV